MQYLDVGCAVLPGRCAHGLALASQLTCRGAGGLAQGSTDHGVNSGLDADVYGC